MMKQISLSGKGSAGKSTIVPFVLQYILQHQPDAKCLVVDADPHMTMTKLMGVPVTSTLGQLRSAYERQIKSGQGLESESRGEFAERVMGEQCLVEMPGYDFLAMGHWELQGCQCGPNRVLGASLGDLAGKRGYDILIVDNEAGIEHIGRFASKIDLLLLVATPRSRCSWMWQSRYLVTAEKCNALLGIFTCLSIGRNPATWMMSL